MAIVALKNGWTAIVDDADAERVASLKWNGTEVNGFRYARAWDPKRRAVVSLHRFLMKPDRAQMVDHANHDGLDNRRSNLRVCTQQQNQFNRRLERGSASGLKGVSLSGRPRKPWRAQATLDGRTRTLGTFKTAVEAHAAYVRFAVDHHGEFACGG